MPSSHDSDRNLLFGIFALQVNFVQRDALLAAMNDWVRDKNKSLGQVLLERGALTPSQVDVIDAVLVEHLKAHGQDIEKSLQAMADASLVRSVYSTVGDEELHSRMSSLTSAVDSEGTRPYDDHQPLDGGRFVRGSFHREGGLGQVYFAHDTELHREVALKEIKPKFADDPGYRGRFVIEAEITGGLEHPGIVPVYGLGAFANGRPYYAMRFIRGENLKDSIDRFHAAETADRNPSERSMAFRQLLRRYIDTCNAVAYAHSRGVVHRDLKPANVMLGKYGETLVVDWGLAKLGVEPRLRSDNASVEPILRPSSGSSPYAVTRGGTIPFMSPEQAADRDDIEPASDIYSLGSTLYVLLTRKRPYEGTDDEDTKEKVKRGVFTPPRAVNAKVPAALDAICRKAMSLRIADRYRTALDLAADVEHWLADEAVEAYREPWTVRAGRWGRRHRSWVVGTAVCLVTAVVGLSVGTGLIWAEQRETEKQRVVAVANYRMAREQLFDSVEMIQAADIDFASSPALHPKRKDILKGAARHCRDSLKSNADDQEMQKRAAVVYRYMANVHRQSDEIDAAEPLYTDAAGLYGVLAEQLPSEAMYGEKWAETLRDQAGFFVKLGRLREAKNNLEKTGKIIAELQTVIPERAQLQQIQASSVLNLANIAHSMGNDADAKKGTDEAVEAFKKLDELPAKKRHPYNRLFLAAALNQAAVLQRSEGDLKKARATHLAAVNLMKELVEKQTSRIAPADLANIKATCALEQCRTLSKIPEAKARKTAETNLGANAQQWGALAGSYPWIPYYRNRQAVALQIRGQLRLDEKGVDAAKKDFDDSHAVLEKLVADHPRVAGYHADLGQTFAGLGRAVEAKGQREEAARWFARAREELGKAVELSPDDVHYKKNLADVPP